jgi:glycosyltransferase involved in cell wall biosynthesis
VTQPRVSVVLPAKNEAERLPGAVERLDPWLDDLGAELVIAVDVGSTDNTAEIANALSGSDDRLRMFMSDFSGKGAAVKAGVEHARGVIILTADTDLAVDPSNFGALIDRARDGVVALASRSVAGSKRLGEPFSRFVAGRGFNFVVRTLVLPTIRDSQCGFKAFGRESGLELLSRTRSTGWAFDVEFLALARKGGLELVEIPVTWQYGHGSTVRMLQDAPSVIKELLDIRRRVGRVGRSGR